MKQLAFSLFALLFINPIFGQDAKTSGDNSPAVIAQNFSATYGVRADAVEAILWIYEAEGYDVDRRKRATEQIIKEYAQSPEKQQKTDVLSEATRSKINNPKIANALEWDLFARKYYLSTTGQNSPAVMAQGDVNIWYGIPSKALRALAAQLEKNKTDLGNFETKLADQVKKYEELETELETYGGKEAIYKQAETLLEEGRLEEAEKLIESDFDASMKRQAYKGYIYGKTKQLLLKYEEAAKGFKNAVNNDEGNSTYHLYFANNENTLAHYDEAIRHYEIALGIDSLKKNDEERIATLINNLGGAWDSKGEYDKAIGYYEKALQILLKTLGKTHPTITTVYNNLGAAWKGKGEYDKAIGYYEKALQIDLKGFGENHSNVATEYNNLGLAWDSKGEYDKAIEYYEKALQILLKAFGENHPNIATEYNNLGLAWDSKSEYDKAIGYYEKALQINLNTLGENHPNVALAYNNLGLVWEKKGEHDKAIRYYEKALQINLNTLGKNHPDVAMIYSNLGAAWSSKEEYNKAIGYYEKALQINLNTLGENHPNVAMIYNNLGAAWSSKEEYNKAIGYYEKALQINLNTLGENHPNVATEYNNLGLVWASKRGYNKAIEYCEKAVQIDLKFFGENHPNIATDYSNLGWAWYEKGEYDKSIIYYEKALKIDLKVFGGSHPNVAKGFNSLGEVWDSKGEYDKAIGYYEKALQIDLKAFGENHPKVATEYNNLGVAWDSKREHDKAIRYYEKCQKIWDIFLEPTHPNQKNTAKSLSQAANDRGMALFSEKKYREALPYFQKALQNAQKAGDDAFLITCLNNIGSMQKHLQEYTAALQTLDTGLVKAAKMTEQISPALIRRMQYHKVGCLKGLKRTKEAETLARQLWQESKQAHETRTLEDLKQEGYDFEKK